MKEFARPLAVADWNGVEFHVIDTGGLLPEARTGLDARVKSQVESALATADVVLLVVDTEVGLIALDEQIGELVRRSGRPHLLVANKADLYRPADERAFEEFVARLAPTKRKIACVEQGSVDPAWLDLARSNARRARWGPAVCR